MVALVPLVAFICVNQVFNLSFRVLRVSATRCGKDPKTWVKAGVRSTSAAKVSKCECHW